MLNLKRIHLHKTCALMYFLKTKLPIMLLKTVRPMVGRLFRSFTTNVAFFHTRLNS